MRSCWNWNILEGQIIKLGRQSGSLLCSYVQQGHYLILATAHDCGNSVLLLIAVPIADKFSGAFLWLRWAEVTETETETETRDRDRQTETETERSVTAHTHAIPIGWHLTNQRAQLNLPIAHRAPTSGGRGCWEWLWISTMVRIFQQWHKGGPLLVLFCSLSSLLSPFWYHWNCPNINASVLSKWYATARPQWFHN